MSSLIKETVDYLGMVDTRDYHDLLTQLTFKNLHVSNIFGARFYWESACGRYTNDNKGPALTAELLYDHRDDKHMIYVIWVAAFVKSLNGAGHKRTEDWCGDPFRFVMALETELCDTYGSWYHSSSNSGLPYSFPNELFAPATSTYQLASIVADMAFHTLKLWTPIRRTTE